MMHERRDERPKNKELHGVVKDAVSKNKVPFFMLCGLLTSPQSGDANQRFQTKEVIAAAAFLRQRYPQLFRQISQLLG